MSTPAVEWTKFSGDPRTPSNASLRASDLDRSVALDALAQAFADGRLDREEYDERSDVVQTSKTLGQLVAPLRDLGPEHVVSSGADLQAKAQRAYVRARQEAFGMFLGPTLVCWGIWLVTSLAGAGFYFPWPVFVTLGTAIRPIQLMVNKRAYVDSQRRKIERKERRAIQQRPH